MEMINRMRKNKKGFTLVEIIVVLVILAILAAFTIPAMLGFVGDSKKKAAIAEQREIYVAAQAIVTEQFGKYGSDTTSGGPSKLGMTITGSGTEAEATSLGSEAVKVASPTGVALEMKNYVSGDITAGAGAAGDKTAAWTVTVGTDGKVKKVTYVKDGITLDPLTPSSAVK